MKICVFITGTNCVGKTSVAKALQRHYGGIGRTEADITYCADGRAAFAGVYRDGLKHGGVDALNRTDTLADIVRKGLETADAVFCEGSYLDTFGMNLCNALFAAPTQLYVFLYADTPTLIARNTLRNDTPASASVIARMLNKQKRVLSSAKKYQQIGVPVLTIDTASHSVEDIAEMILKRIEQ